MNIIQAIHKHGAQAVYDAASRHMAGDKARGLDSVGLSADTMADVWRIHSEAYAQLGEAGKAIDHASAKAALDDIGKRADT